MCLLTASWHQSQRIGNSVRGCGVVAPAPHCSQPGSSSLSSSPSHYVTVSHQSHHHPHLSHLLWAGACPSAWPNNSKSKTLIYYQPVWHLFGIMSRFGRMFQTIMSQSGTLPVCPCMSAHILVCQLVSRHMPNSMSALFIRSLGDSILSAFTGTRCWKSAHTWIVLTLRRTDMFTRPSAQFAY